MLSTPPAFILSQDQTLCKNARNFVAAVTLRCIFTEKPPATDAHSASRWRPAAPASEKTICCPFHSSRFDRSRYPLGYLFLFYCLKVILSLPVPVCSAGTGGSVCISFEEAAVTESHCSLNIKLLRIFQGCFTVQLSMYSAVYQLLDIITDK